MESKTDIQLKEELETVINNIELNGIQKDILITRFGYMIEYKRTNDKALFYSNRSYIGGVLMGFLYCDLITSKNYDEIMKVVEGLQYE